MPAAAAQVPRLVKFSGAVKDADGKPVSSLAGIAFALYQDQRGGTPLWIENQNVQPDAAGRYTVWLGATKNEGAPVELFASGQARWLGVQVEGQPEQSRVLLAAVPYALKAVDAETVGGLPPSAFLLAGAGAAGAQAVDSHPRLESAADATPAVGGSGTQNYIPMWTDSAGTLGNSVLFQSGTGSTAKIGVNIATPAATLDVKGTSVIRGTLSLPATGAAVATAGKTSEPLNLTASVFNSGTSAAVPQTFQLRGDPVGNNTATASGALSLLYGSGTSVPAETGLQIASNGRITFASGQTFPGTGAGTITGVTAGADLAGGGTSGNVTLNLDTTKVPQLNAANVFTTNQTVNGTVTGTQLVSSVATGAAPLVVSSTTQVNNLNASFLGGFSAGNFQAAGTYATLGANTFAGDQKITGNVSATGSVSGVTAKFSGTVTEAGALLPSAGTATAATGYNSQPVDAAASAYSSSLGQAVSQDFQWLAEPVGNNTSAPSGKLDLLFGANGATPAETGLSVASNGQITFATGQTFPGTGPGGITEVTAGAGLSGGGTSGNITLANTGVLAVGVGPGVSEAGAASSPVLSLNTGYTDSRYLQLAGGALSGALTLPADGLAAGTQLVLAGGNVGIGTSTPGALLEVAGNMKISGTGGMLTFPDGSTQATAVSAGPDGVIAVNPQQVALLKWFPAYQSPATFPVGTPAGVAFDGASIWVTNSDSNTVTKLRASDGAVLGTFSAGSNPIGMAFDGANIWVANNGSNTVTKLRASDGVCVGTCTFSVGNYPTSGVAFDGANIWVTAYRGNNVTKLRASDGACVGTCTFSVGTGPEGAAFDGANIWVTNFNSNNVTKLRASDGACVGTCTFSVGGNPMGVAFDGANIWVANFGGTTVTKLRASDGACVGTCTFTVGLYPFGIAFDGANIWVANWGGNTVTKLRASDGACAGTCTFGVGAYPAAVAFDGANIWVANSGSGTVSKL